MNFKYIINIFRYIASIFVAIVSIICSAQSSVLLTGAFSFGDINFIIVSIVWSLMSVSGFVVATLIAPMTVIFFRRIQISMIFFSVVCLIYGATLLVVPLPDQEPSGIGITLFLVTLILISAIHSYRSYAK